MRSTPCQHTPRHQRPSISLSRDTPLAPTLHRDLRRALENDPDSPYPLLNLGITLDYLGRYTEPSEPLRKVMQLRPQWVAPHT